MKKNVLALLVLLVLLVAACGPTTAPTEEAAPPPTEEAALTPTEEPDPVPTEEAAPPEKTLLTLAHSWPARVDPGIGADFIALTLHTNIYDTLVFPTTDGGIVPWVAESWDVSDDNLTYTFHLREGVKFHDGSTVDANDVVRSWDAGLNAASPYHVGNTGSFEYPTYLFDALMNLE